MHDLSHILTGTDFSESSKGAVREALRLAGGDASRRVTLVHVTRHVKDPQVLLDRLTAWAQELPEFGSLTDPAQFKPELEIGRVSSGLARCAMRIGATQLVVGPLPRTLLERYVTGGVAEQLFHSVHIPVLATRRPVEGGYKHILVPVDFSENSHRAVSLAASLARDSSASDAAAHLELLHVAELPGGAYGGVVRKGLANSVTVDIEKQLHAYAAERGVADLVGRVSAVVGVVQDAIPKEVKRCGADLVCMASSSSGSLLGSTADAVLRSVGVPMLFVALADD